MPYSKEHRAQVRDRIVESARRLFNRSGFEAVSIDSIMEEAGLTHGGFYAHFGSKDELVAEAIKRMFEEAGARRRAAADGKPPVEGLRDYIKFYLSRSHRDGRAAGCPLAALATDLPRLPEPARVVFGQGVASLTASLAEMLAGIGWPQPEEAAGALLSQMVGAVSLARSVADSAQSDQILLTARNEVLSRFGLEFV
jgi:TetR/AcrR family transcriptional repressor of nem operon